MKRTIYYYNAFITFNGQVTNIHLSDMLDRIQSVDVIRRLKRLKQGHLCLMNMSDPLANLDNEDDRKVVMGKFRENKPYLSTLGTDRIDEIPDDVIELTSIFYRRDSRLLIVEYNHNGMRPNALVYYLNSFLPRIQNGTWSVVLEQIEPDLGFQDVSQSRDIKSIEFKVDLTARNRRIYDRQNEEDFHESVLGNILNTSIETHREFGANFATVGFSNGKKWRSNVIDATQLVAVLRSLDLDSEVFESINIVYVSPTTGRKETLNLKNQGVLKQVIDVNMNDWMHICNSIENYFYNNGRIGEDNHLEYHVEINEELPGLIYNEAE